MKISLSMKSRSFFFIEEVAIRKGGGSVEVDLSKRNDNFKASIANAIAWNIIACDKSIEEVANTITDLTKRAAVKRATGVRVSEEEIKALEKAQRDEVGTFNDTLSAKVVEVVEVVEEPEETVEETVDEVTETVDEIEDQVQVESEVQVDETSLEVGVSDDTLKEILNGSVKEVGDAIANNDLSTEDLIRLQELEAEGKDRSGVKTLVNEVI